MGVVLYCDLWVWFCIMTCGCGCCRYTAVRGFGKTVLETNDLAGQRELIAEYMEAEVCMLSLV